MTFKSTKLTKSVALADSASPPPHLSRRSPPSTNIWRDKLLPEQVPAFDHIVAHDGTLLLGDTSSGKSFITMAVLEQARPPCTLIIAPLTSVPVTWEPKLATLGAQGFTIYRDWASYRDTRQKRPRGSVGPAVLILHYQAASRLAKPLGCAAWSLVVIDEAQGLKARSSGWSRLARRLRFAERRLALTATPMDDSPIDLWGIMRFVDHAIFGEDWGDFANEFCQRGGFMNHEWRFKSSMMPEFLRRLTPSVFRLSKTFLKLPPVNVRLIPVDLLGSQAAYYEQMRQHSVVVIGGRKIVAPLEVTRQGKLEQMTGGAVLDEDRNVIAVGNAKKRKLAALIPKVRLPVVVSCKYLHEIGIVRSVLEERFKNVREMHGGIRDGKKGAHRTNLIADFQAGNIDALVLQLRTGGVSIEFTRASSLILYSMNFSLIDFEQVIGRFHRAGQEYEVNVYLIYAQNTVDEDIISDVKTKRSDFYQIVDHFEEIIHGSDEREEAGGRRSS